MGIINEASDALIAQLRRLQEVDIENRDALELEISRSKAVQSVAGTLIDSGRLIAQVRRDAAEYGEEIVPKGLINR